MGGEVLSNIPLGQTLASALPEYPTKLDYGFGKATIPSRQQLFGDNDPTRFGNGLLVAKGFQDPLYKLAFPWGGDQLKRSIEGIGAVKQGASITNQGKMRYPIAKTLPNAVQSGLFGQYSLPEGREYFDKGGKSLSEKQTATVMNSQDPQQAYSQFLKKREYNNLVQKLKAVAGDTMLSQTDRDRQIDELREKILNMRAAQ